jgi:hypothetical protein
MNSLGTSLTVPAHLLVWAFAILLIWSSTLPPGKNWLSVVLTLVAGATIVAIPIVMVFMDLNQAAVLELATVAILLCISLWVCHRVRRQNAHSLAAELSKKTSPE